MAVLIDTSVVVEAERGRLDLQNLHAGDPGQPAALTAVTVAEMLAGVELMDGRARRDHASAFIEGLVQTFPVLSFDLEAARVHARMAARLRKSGTPVCAHDLMIAAIAVAGGHSVVTRDRRSFPRIPGLSLGLVA